MIGILRDLVKASVRSIVVEAKGRDTIIERYKDEYFNVIDADLLLENIEKVRNGTFYKPEDSQNNQDKSI